MALSLETTSILSIVSMDKKHELTYHVLQAACTSQSRLPDVGNVNAISLSQEKRQKEHPAKMEEEREATVVPVVLEPLHQQRWISDTVRVVGVRFSPHTTCQWHQHFHFSVYICINDLIATEQVLNQPPRMLTQPRGSVLCRDHTQDQLVHIAASHEEPIFVVVVELLKQRRQLEPHDAIPLHVGRGVMCVNDSLECRVCRISLSSAYGDDNKRDELSLVLRTDAVLVALHECVLSIHSRHAAKEGDNNGDDNSQQPREPMHSFQPGDDAVLLPGRVVIQLLSRSARVDYVELVLVEVF